MAEKQASDPDEDMKAKYREALERKSKTQHKTAGKGSADGSRGAKGEHAAEANKREFRRKSGG